MKRIQDLEGELVIDHRNSPGVPDEILEQAGLPTGTGRGLFEAPIYTCNHCQQGVTVIVKAFGLREKRFVCSICRKVICEDCAKEKALTGVCVPFEAKVEAVLAQAK